MKKITTTICLALISSWSYAQLRGLPAENLSYIPSKSFTSPAFAGQDSVLVYRQTIKTTRGFFANRFEVSNKEYRAFVVYVRDSIAHTLLKHINGSGQVDWNRKIDWKDPLLESMMQSAEDRFVGNPEIDPEKIVYQSVSIYPDTLVWIRDFAYSYNEPLVKKYFAHHEYDNYPVVGVNLEQARAFCQWKTTELNRKLKQKGSDYEVIVRLPTNAEWESAATNGESNDKNDFYNTSYKSNFGAVYDKNGFPVKDYDDDGYYYTNPVQHYGSGPHGLYNMKGNIAEWTSDKAGDLMNNDNNNEDFIIVKGGGWDSNPFYLQTGTCQFFPATAAHSFIGFRYVVDFKKK